MRSSRMWRQTQLPAGFDFDRMNVKTDIEWGIRSRDPNLDVNLSRVRRLTHKCRKQLTPGVKTPKDGNITMSQKDTHNDESSSTLVLCASATNF